MNLKSIILTLSLALPVFPWGSVGHETVARIAQDNLNPATMAKIKPYLSGESLEDVSIWADTYKRSHRNTGPWHYINLPVRENVTVNNISQYYNTGHHPTDNVVCQIKVDIKELKNPQASFKEKQLALKYLVHFIGDVHMPLHVGDDDDKGGNGKRVRYFSPTSQSKKGHVTNLHSLWDNLVAVKAAENPTELGDELNKKISSSEKQNWLSGSVENWAIESYLVSKKTIYPGFNHGSDSTVVNLQRNYYSKMRPICDEQLEKAGVRLAYVLEDIFGK
jgi:hypothetical protein